MSAYEAMTYEKACSLPMGTRVRIKQFYAPTDKSNGDVTGIIGYGEYAHSVGVIIDGYDYPFAGDIHGFNGWTDEMIKKIEVIDQKEDS